MTLSRRGLLLSGLGALVLASGVGEYFEVLPGGVQLHRLLGLTGGTGTIPDVPAARTTVRQFHSAARGRMVDVVTMIPGGAPARLPVCLVLHGRNNNARGMITLGLPQFLTAAMGAGVPPLAFVAVDGGAPSRPRERGDLVRPRGSVLFVRAATRRPGTSRDRKLPARPARRRLLAPNAPRSHRLRGDTVTLPLNRVATAFWCRVLPFTVPCVGTP